MVQSSDENARFALKENQVHNGSGTSDMTVFLWTVYRNLSSISTVVLLVLILEDSTLTNKIRSRVLVFAGMCALDLFANVANGGETDSVSKHVPIPYPRVSTYVYTNPNGHSGK